MTRKYKKYDKDFKLEAAKLVTEHGYPYVEAARQLGLEDWTVRGWVKALRKSGDSAPSVAADLKELRVENAKLRIVKFHKACKGAYGYRKIHEDIVETFKNPCCLETKRCAVS
jgi:transposase-like protein